MYVNVTLKRNNFYKISWIPKKFAVLDKVLKLKNEDNEWEDGWKVIKVGKIELENINHPPTLIRHHRKQTGDSERRFP